jgi:hypothetical protein
MIEDGELLAWIDGELADGDAARVAVAAADPTLNARAAAHRQLAERLANWFAPLLATPPITPYDATPVASPAAARASRLLIRLSAAIHWQRHTALAATLMARRHWNRLRAGAISPFVPFTVNSGPNNAPMPARRRSLVHKAHARRRLGEAAPPSPKCSSTRRLF